MPTTPLATVNEWAGEVEGASWSIRCGDAAEVLATLPSSQFSAVVTSPPYFWQRDYGIDGQLGHENTVGAYVDKLCGVMDQVRRVMNRRGVLFLNLGDTYYSGKGRPHGTDKKHPGRRLKMTRAVDVGGLGMPKKSLIGIPWRVALGMIDRGWILRSPIVWRRPHAIPEPSVDDRPWRTYEHVFMFVKSRDNWFDRSPLVKDGVEDIWSLPSQSSRERVHPAVFPTELVDRCLDLVGVRAGSVLDPYAGTATTVARAVARGLDAVGIELNPDFCAAAATKLSAVSL